MLKVLKPDTYAGIANAKCGEIYFQSLTSYRIDCVFCDMKSFDFSDFVLHIQNVHFEDSLLKTDVLVPKQEQGESPVAMMAQVNPFPWYSIDDDDNFEQPNIDDANSICSGSDLAGHSIMKWNKSTSTKTGETKESTRNKSVKRKCSLTVKYTEDTDDSLEHSENENKQLVGQLLGCEYCVKMYKSKKALNRHLQHAHEHKSPDSAPDSEGDADYKQPKAYTTKPTMEYKCEHCDKVYHGKYTLRQHIKRDHNIDIGDQFTCPECNKQVPRLRLLDEHAVEAHGGSRCEVCGRRYKTRHELKRHQLRHTDERNVLCTHTGCGKTFLTTRHMRNHLKVHSDQKNFVCENCGYSCRNKETLRVHMRSHTGERPFVCKVCSKSFPSHSGLREHMAMHSTERPYVCKVCGATFSRQKGLYHHKFLHTDTKQFMCKLCGNAYAQAAGLAGHMRKHRNDEVKR